MFFFFFSLLPLWGIRGKGKGKEIKKRRAKKPFPFGIRTMRETCCCGVWGCYGVIMGFFCLYMPCHAKKYTDTDTLTDMYIRIYTC
jgi:hypothetical protein